MKSEAFKKEKSLDKMKFLLVGPRYQSHSSQIGGTTVSFETLIAYFKVHQFRFNLISTNTFRKRKFDVLNYIRVFPLIIVKTAFADIIMFNLSPRGIAVFAPLIWFSKKIFRKKIVIRPFGGKIEMYFQHSSAAEKYLLKASLKVSDLVCLQTKELLNAPMFRAFPKYWLPTSRDFSNKMEARNTYRKRYVFISQIHRTKGINTLIQIKEQLPPDFTLDVYGPILDDEFLFLKDQAYYKGIVAPDNISKTLSEYDVLLFPSTYLGEGYPGIIIEAFVCAMPVFALCWRSIPELIVNGSNGILVPSNNPMELLDEMLSLDETRYRELSRGVVSRRDEFDQEKINKQLLERISGL